MLNPKTYHQRVAHIILPIILMVILSLSTTACAAVSYGSAVPVSAAQVPITLGAGEILSTAPGTTLYGIINVLSQAPGTQILVNANNKLVVLAWPVKDIGYAWVQIRNTASGFNDLVAGCGGRGNIANYDTWASLSEFLQTGGWSKAQTTAISAPLITQLLAAAGASVVGTAINSLPTIIIMPATTLPDIERLLNGNEVNG